MNEKVMELNKLGLDTMIREGHRPGGTWNPKSVNDFESMLNILPYSPNNGYLTRKNIAYNLQYLEYLQKQLDEMIFSEVLQKMVIKSYIITGMSIVEALFAYLLRYKNEFATSEWKSVHKNNFNNEKEMQVGEAHFRIQTEVFKRVERYECDMSLDAMIKKIKDKKIIGFNNKTMFDVLSYLRKFRNKVHLYASDSGQTEYYSFSIEQQLAMKYSLIMVLSHPIFCADSTLIDTLYDFLKLSQEDVKRLQSAHL